MLGLEPKDLPVGTTISMESNGRWTKDRVLETTVWIEDNNHCGECAEWVFDTPTEEILLKVEESRNKSTSESSQEFFGMDWSIVSVPWHFAVLLTKEVHDQRRPGGLITDHILKHAILRYTKAEEEDN